MRTIAITTTPKNKAQIPMQRKLLKSAITACYAPLAATVRSVWLGVI